jgi:ABC-type lipoprotein export system ATPase subunit
MMQMANDSKIYFFTGSSGTGKTTLMEFLLIVRK